MRLEELEPTFVRYETKEAEYLIKVPDLKSAQGIKFLCPSCFVKNSGSIGTHGLEVTFSGRGAKDNQGSRNRLGKPSRWNVSGSCYADLTLTPSILIDPAKPACDGWHGFITNGEVK
jgi:hypothetical protein